MGELSLGISEQIIILPAQNCPAGTGSAGCVPRGSVQSADMRLPAADNCAGSSWYDLLVMMVSIRPGRMDATIPAHYERVMNERERNCNKYSLCSPGVLIVEKLYANCGMRSFLFEEILVYWL